MHKKWRYVLFAAIAHAVLIVWFLGIDHMFFLDVSPFVGIVVVLLIGVLLVVAVVIAARWQGSSKKGKPVFTAADWFLTVCIGWLIAGLYYRCERGIATIDLQVHDTMFVMSISFVSGCVAGLFGLFAAVYYGYPSIVGRPLQHGVGLAHFWVSFLGSFIVFIPMIFGRSVYMPRRYTNYNYSRWLNYAVMPNWYSWMVLAVTAAEILFIANLVYSAVKGRKSAD